MNFSGDISVLYGAMAFIMVLAILIVILGISRSTGTTFYIHEHGIIAERRGERKTTRFYEMRDLYLFSSGRQFYLLNNLAYRRNEHEEWQAISTIHSGSSKAIEYIRQRHQAIHAPRILQQLAESRSATFHYIDQTSVIARKFTATGTVSFLQVQSKEITLQKDKLIIGTEVIFLSDIQRFSVSDWTSQIQLFNYQNKPLFKIFFSSVFSGDTFTAVLDKLINR